MDQDAKLGFLRNCFDTQTYPNYFLDAVLRKYDGDVIAAVKSLVCMPFAVFTCIPLL